MPASLLPSLPPPFSCALSPTPPLALPPYQPPADQGLTLVHVDESILVLDKPAGLLSVPGRGAEKADCLASRVQLRYPEALIVHRLDMETSGLMLMARNAEVHRALSRLFEQRQIAKRYIALLDGQLTPNEGRVDLPLITDWPNRPRQKVDLLLGKPSHTLFRCLGYDAQQDCSRVALEPLTGRSHQLRVHMQALGHPILGDLLYASPAALAKASRLQLHAEWLSFLHPVTGNRCEFHSPAPF